MILAEMLWLATMAWLTSVLSITASLMLDARPDVEHAVGTVGGLAAAFMWTMAAFGATSIQIPSNGVILQEGSEGVALLFAGFAFFMVVVALMDTAWMLNTLDLRDDRSLR